VSRRVEAGGAPVGTAWSTGGGALTCTHAKDLQISESCLRNWLAQAVGAPFAAALPPVRDNVAPYEPAIRKATKEKGPYARVDRVEV
jgi:hypothetical protein